MSSSHTNSSKYLKKAGYTYNPENDTWKHRKKSISEENILIYLIKVVKSLKIRYAGEWAGNALELAKSEPEITFKSFKQAHLKREYGARVKGLDVSLEWIKPSDTNLLREITTSKDNLILWIRKYSQILHRFYNAAERAGIHIRQIARE